ncbi:hypothetical protein L6452_20717 [Arctium lappa]|uniref:Uncharacterized protein n=1 Tax=Arctium lappa TaxID=4217 RepID=A0ACB9BBC6_ARCLA|nr:hypothetical protein L6452_20717 [Arctium lappa]
MWAVRGARPVRSPFTKSHDPCVVGRSPAGLSEMFSPNLIHFLSSILKYSLPNPPSSPTSSKVPSTTNLPPFISRVKIIIQGFGLEVSSSSSSSSPLHHCHLQPQASFLDFLGFHQNLSGWKLMDLGFWKFCLKIQVSSKELKVG